MSSWAKRFYGLLLLTRLPLLVWAGSDTVQIESAELSVLVIPLDRDVYRITISPNAASTNAAAGTDSCVSLDGSTEVRRHDDWLEARRLDDTNAPALWRGRFSALPSYGRAKVPGTRLEWTALPGEVIYGLGERFNGLNQAGKLVEMWNRDAPGQSDTSYFCTPVLMSLPAPSQRSGGQAGNCGYALFAADNPEGEFSLNPLGEGFNRYLRAGQTWTMYLALAPTLKELLRQRARIQGPFRDIPDWAWGPWISRNSFENQAEAEEVIRGMVQRGFPVAAIVQEAWKGSSDTGDFNNFSTNSWPRVDHFLAACDRYGIRNVLWQVPVVHPSAPGFPDLAERGFFVRQPDHSVSWRREWMEGFANLDFTRPEAVRWWQDQMRDEIRLGVRGFKADDGEDIKADDVFADGRRGWQMHNEFTRLYARALFDLFDQEQVDGLLWCRSASLGCEQTPALWAGDQYATWAQYRSLLPAGLSAGLSGAPFWGHDIGGYIDNPSPELYIRWLQFGAFSPLMQYHGVHRREPWEFGPGAVAAYQLLSRLRMNIKPTLIALGREAAETGLPIMRPMALEFPDDPRFGSEDTQYMLGPDLLVAPVLEEDTPGRRVKFPAGRWQHLLSPAVYEGPAERAVASRLVDAPVFVREGARLRVQLAEGAELGAWSSNAPEREYRFDPERVSVTNPPAPPFLTVVNGGSRVAANGSRILLTRIRNIADTEVRVRVRAKPGAHVAMGNTGVEDVVPARATKEIPWNITLSADQSVGEAAVAFELTGAGQTDITEARLVLAPRWVVAGPFPAEPRQAYGIHFPPEWEPGADVSFVAGSQRVQWTAVPPEHPVEHDGIDFKALLGDHDHAAAYAMTRLSSDRAREVELRFGSDDTLTVWLNGELLYSVETYRLAAYDQEVVPARLKAGDNTLLVKVAQDINPWRLMFRITGPGGALLSGVRDGFNNLEAYSPDRPPAYRTIGPAPGIDWDLSGPYPLDATNPIDQFASAGRWPGGEADIHWKHRTASPRRDPTVDLNTELGPSSNCCAYAATQLVAGRETPVEFICGSDDGLSLWLNGREILRTLSPRVFKAGADRVKAQLRVGTNVVFCRVTQGGGEWKFRTEVYDLSKRPSRPRGAP